MHFSSASVVQLEISHVSQNDRFAVVANCYGDEAVAPSYVRFTELFCRSFHCSVLRVLKIRIHFKYFRPSTSERIRIC